MNTIQSHKLARQVIVIGGSIAGLLTARVLSEYVSRVVILEKDELQHVPSPRRGTPHGHQLHSIHQTGAEIVHKLFPDMVLDFPSSGLIPCDLGSEMRWFFYGDWMPDVPAEVNAYWCERPRFEWALRRRVADLPNVTVMAGYKVTGLIPDASKRRIVGVTVQQSDARQTAQDLFADLVVDAGGRGSRVPQWLAALDYAKPSASTVQINFGDATGTYQLPPDFVPSWKALLISAKPGLSQRLGLIHMLPNNRMKVLLAGWFGDHPPADEAGFLDFARSLPRPDIYECLRRATLLSPIYTHKLPSNRWYHYEKMSRWPDGLLVAGDAVCSFNPSYGQGMTVAALHAMELQKLLDDLHKGGQSLVQPGIGRRFQTASAQIIKNPWMITTGEDLRFPQAEGPRPRSLAWVHRYLGRVFDAAHRDPGVAKRFLEVMTFVREPSALFHPDVLLALARYRLNQRHRKPSIKPGESFSLNEPA